MELHKKKLRDGGYSVEQKYPMKYEDTDEHDKWFRTLKFNSVITYNEKIYMLKTRGRKIKNVNDHTMIDYVELLELKLPKMVDQFIRGDTWHP